MRVTDVPCAYDDALGEREIEPLVAEVVRVKVGVGAGVVDSARLSSPLHPSTPVS